MFNIFFNYLVNDIGATIVLSWAEKKTYNHYDVECQLMDYMF